MRSYRIVEYGKPLRLFETPPPEPAGTEVLLRTLATGVCHTDLHIRDGGYDVGGGRQMRLADRGQTLPHTMGHETAGRVIAAGPDAGEVAQDPTYVIYPWMGCGQCAICRADEEQLCPSARYLGVFRDGGYADHVLIPHPRYLVDAGSVDPALAALLACSGLTAFSALKKIAPRLDQPLLIIGAGGVGLMCLSILKAMRGRGAIVADVNPAKRDAAVAAGALAAIDPSTEDAVARIQQAAGGPLWSIIDFVGAPATWQLAFGAICKGGTYVMVGLYGGETQIALPVIPLRAITVAGSFVGSRSELVELIDLVQRASDIAVPVLRRPLAAVNSTLEDLEHGQLLGRAVLEP